MAADQREEMTDAELDHEVLVLLAVDPSPAFVPRVRARVAVAPVRASWWSLRPVAAGAAAAVAVLGIVWVQVRPEAPRSTDRQISGRPTVPLTTRNALPGHRSAEALALQSAAPQARPGRPASGAREAAAPRPEVVIDAREALALRALMRGVGDGRIDLQPALAATTPPVMEFWPIEDIAIAPLVIPPLEEGARQ